MNSLMVVHDPAWPHAEGVVRRGGRQPVLASLGASILPQLRLAFTAFPCLKVTLGWICSFTSCVAVSPPRVRASVTRGHEPLCGLARDREYDAVTHPVGVKLQRSPRRRSKETFPR